MTSEITDERILWEKRARYNPLLNLTPQKLRTANDAFKIGYLSQAARIWEEVEEADGIIATVGGKRRKSVSRLSWNIVPLGAADGKTAQRHADVLEDFYNNISWSSACDKHRSGGFSRLVEAMLDCIGKKYSVHEIIWKPIPQQRKLRAEFKFVPLYFFENTIGELRLLRSPMSITGDELKAGKWLVAAADKPLMKACSVYYLMKNMSLADWLVFSRRFGSALAAFQSDAAPDSEKWNDMAEALANIDNESSFMYGTGDKLELMQVSGQNAPFKEIIDYLQRLVITMWLGSDLATMSSQDGAGASLQGESAAMLEDDDCQLLEETLAATVSSFVIRYYFGNVEPAAYLQFQRTDRSDKKSALEILGMTADRGVAVSQKAWREASGVAAPDEGEPCIEKSATGVSDAAFGANEYEISADLAELAKARAKDGKPLADEIERIGKITDPAEYADALQNLYDNILDFYNGGKNEAEAMAKILKKAIDEK